MSGWLRDLKIEEGENELLHNCERQKYKIEPLTPPRRAILQDRCEEISPADTSFPGGSIFDAPERYYEPGSPCPIGKFRDDISEISSYEESEDHDDTTFDAEDKNAETRITQPNFTSARLRPPSLHSYGLISDHEEDSADALVPVEVPGPLPQDPDAPRIVNLVSCMQCTLANQSCSRTSPSCSRCIRNGSSSACLLLRRRFASETNHLDPSSCALPILLKLKGQDEDMWAKKLEVMGEFNKKWTEQEDKRNWVLPSAHSERRGDWSAKTLGRRRMHPGAGIGRLRFEELVVDMDM